MSSLADLILSKYHDAKICGETKRRAIIGQLVVIQKTYLYLTFGVVPEPKRFEFDTYLGDLINDLRSVR